MLKEKDVVACREQQSLLLSLSSGTLSQTHTRPSPSQPQVRKRKNCRVGKGQKDSREIRAQAKETGREEEVRKESGLCVGGHKRNGVGDWKVRLK